MTRLAAFTLALALSTCAPAPVLAYECVPFDIAAELDPINEQHLEADHIEGWPLAALLFALRDVIDIEGEPDEALIVYSRTMARIGLVHNGERCQTVDGPADWVRALLKTSRGIEV